MFGKGIFRCDTGKLNYLRNCFLEGNITLLGIFSVTYSLLQLYEFFFCAEYLIGFVTYLIILTVWNRYKDFMVAKSWSSVHIVMAVPFHRLESDFPVMMLSCITKRTAWYVVWLIIGYAVWTWTPAYKVQMLVFVTG
jgi:hypothetical protein